MIRKTILGASLLLAAAAPTSAQTTPPGAVPACETPRYLELKAIATTERSAEQAEEFHALDTQCSRGLIAYYQYNASRYYRSDDPMERFDRREREPAMALLSSMLLVGGGQFYNREPGKGILYLSLAALGAYTFLAEGQSADGDRTLRDAGLGLYVGATLGSMIDAVQTAGRSR